MGGNQSNFCLLQLLMIMETFEIFKNIFLSHFWTSMWYVVVSLKISKLSKSMEIAEKMSWGMVSMYHLCYYHALKWFYDLAVKSLSWQAHWDEIIFEVIFLLQLCSCVFTGYFLDFLNAYHSKYNRFKKQYLVKKRTFATVERVLTNCD